MGVYYNNPVRDAEVWIRIAAETAGRNDKTRDNDIRASGTAYDSHREKEKIQHERCEIKFLDQ